MIPWKGSFVRWEESQSIGHTYSCNNFFLWINFEWVPVDWNRLKDFDREQYSGVMGKVKEVFKNSKHKRIHFMREDLDAERTISH